MQTAARAGRESTRARAAAGVLVFAALAVVVWIGLVAPNGLPWSSHYTLRAEFDQLSNLAVHNEVRIAGRRVGQVLNPRLVDGRAVVDVQLDDDVGPLPSDTTAVVRAKGLLGSRYLELRPGDAQRVLPDGATIGAERTRATVDLAEFLGAFDPRRRASLRSLIRGFGDGFAGRGGHVNETLRKLPELLTDVRLVSSAVSQRPGAATRFFPSLRSVAAAADPVRRDIAAGFDPQAGGLRPFADEREGIRRALDVAPGALEDTRAGLAGSRPLLVEAAGFARATTGALDAAPASLRQTRLLLAGSERPLRRTDQLLRRLGPAVPSVLKLMADLEPALDPLEEAFRESRPPLDELAKRPCDVTAWARRWRSALEFGVPGGGEIGPLNALRLSLISTPETLGKRAPAIGSNPYPDPCAAGEERVP